MQRRDGTRVKGLYINTKTHILTAFGSPWNSFLGYFIDSNSNSNSNSISSISSINGKTRRKVSQGLIWGKDPKHYQGKIPVLLHVARQFEGSVILISTSTEDVFTSHLNQGNGRTTTTTSSNSIGVKWVGHLTAQQWNDYLRESKFLLGLGHPLLGPSAIDAISAGCVYINPIYDTPMKEIHFSQHTYAMEHIGLPYVCSYSIHNESALEQCIKYAIQTDLNPFIPSDFLYQNYVERVRNIFKL